MRKSLIISTAMFTVAGLLPAAAFAADPQTAATSNSAPTALEEVVVTANKRAENLQNVPTSAAVLNGKELKAFGVTSTTQIADFVPGVQLMTINSGSDNFFSIRGVTQDDFAEHEESPVAMYIDGVYFSQAGGTSALLFDTSRVEVLRGPQGTLFGRNATGGVVQYYSATPTDHPDGYIETSYGNYNQNHTEGAYSDKIADGLSFRISGSNDYMDPYLTNTISNGHNAGGRNAHGLRFQLKYQPNSDFDATLNVHGSESRVVGGFYKYLNVYADPNNHDLSTIVPNNVNQFGTCTGCNSLGYSQPAGTNYYTGESNVVGHDWLSTYGATETVNYHFNGLTLTSISDYTHFSKNYYEDSDATPTDIASFWTGVNTPQVSEEIRLSNGSQGPLRWVTGLYYLQIDGHYLEGAGYGPAIGAPSTVETYTINTKSWSEFGQVEYDILKNLTLTIGGRWSTDQKKLNLAITQLSCDTPNCPVDTTVPLFIVDPATAGNFAKYNKSDWSGKVALDWHVTKGIMPYISWSKGVKSGGFNAPNAEYDSYSYYKFNEEKLYSTEVGIKSQFFNNRLRLDADGFYYNYVGYQATNTLNNNTYITNQPARIDGAEFEATALPLPQLRIHQGLALLDTTILGIALPDGTYANRQAVQAPHTSYTGSIDYTWYLAKGDTVNLADDYSYRSSQYFQLSNDPAVKENGYWLDNVHVEYTTPSGHWSVRGYVNNVFNQDYLTNIFAVGSINLGQGVYGLPRLYGIRLTYHM